MRTSDVLAILTITAIALAGCSGGDRDGEGDSSSSSSSSSRSTSSGSSSTSRSSSSASSTSTAPPANQAPVGSLSAAVNGTNATFTLTGSDPDGDTLVWDLTFGDGASANGTTLPANLTHAYASAGNFTVGFTLTDGEDPTTYEVDLTVGAAGGAPSFVITGSTSQTGSPASSGVLLGGTPGLGAKACAGFMTDMNEFDCVFGAVPAEMAGRAYLYESTVDSPDFEFYDACAPDGEATQAFGGDPTGTVPEGTGCIIMWNFGAATGQFTMTIG